MQKTRTILILFFVYVQVSAQQLSFREPGFANSPAFSLRYSNTTRTTVSINALPLLKEKGVKKMRIYDAKGFLVYFFEFDSTGNISGEGYYGNTYFTVKQKHVIGKVQMETQTYYLGPLLMRSDTTTTVSRAYKNADTLIEFEEKKNVVYKRGDLINEQNYFYDRAYFNNFNHFRTNYDSSFLFLCTSKYYGLNFEASVRNKLINLDTNSLKEHPFFKNFNSHREEKYYVEGEDFTEPDIRSVVFCGTMLNHHSDMEETLNENGLFDSLYVYLNYGKTLSYYAKYDYYEKP